MLNRLKVILIGAIVAVVAVSLVPTTPAHAAWPHPAPHGELDVYGHCDGSVPTQRGIWNFSGLINSPLRGGDTYKMRFMAYTVGGGTAWSKWSVRYKAPQKPSFNWVSFNAVFHIKRHAWTAVYMELHSAKHGKVFGDWLKQDRLGGDLSEVSSNGYYCRTIG